VSVYQLELDPFLGIDHFTLRVPRSPPHPHAGFCALTYVLDDSEGSLVTRDSLGHAAILRPGDLCWTTAGRGIVHEEVPAQPGVPVHGLQVFVNIPSGLKRMPASVQYLDARSVPVLRAPGGARARVVVGRSGDCVSPLLTPAEVSLVDVTAPPGGRFEHPLDPAETAMALVLAGNGFCSPTSRMLRAGEVGSFARDGDRLEVRAGRSGIRIAIFAGRALREPIVAGGPFIMSTDDELEQAMGDYRSGRMGSLKPSF
jgi:redox-sensitive bicupin YhaK (pirin superfamily)